MRGKAIVFATKNEGKLREIRAVFSDWEIVSLNSPEFSSGGFDIAEDGETFEQNAVKKAETISALISAPVLADDSGLEIDFLNGAPGVKSARFLGKDTPYGVKNAKILELLAGVPFKERSARFVCVIAFSVPKRPTLTAKGVINGVIHTKAAGCNGFGYDPIFFVPELNKTTAELSLSEKNAISHRGRALTQMREMLRAAAL